MDNYEKEAQLPRQTPEQNPQPVANTNYFHAAADLSGTEIPVRPVNAPVVETAPQQQYAPYTPNAWGPAAPQAPYGVPNPYAAPRPYAPPAAPVPAQPAPAAQSVSAPPKEETPAEEKQADQTKKSGKGRIWLAIAAAAATIGLIVGGCLITAKLIDRKWEQKYTQMSTIHNQQVRDLQSQIDQQANAPAATGGQANSGITIPAGEGMTPSQVYAQNVNAVVAIQSTLRGGQSMGSGFIMTADGYVTTNYHVVDGATKIEVITHDGTSYPAELVGYDNTNDVAVLKMEGDSFPFVTVGVSDSLIVGDQVVAIGNPLGELTNTLTVGYVSAKERGVNTDGITINMIQTDAAINSGNSGGPLFNMKGEVVGITTAKYSGESSSGATIEGIGFAIPIDDVYDLIDDLITEGYVRSAYLGVMVSEMNAEAAAYYGYPVGAYVQEVTPGYCAEAAGLQAEDIIVALGTHKVKGLSDLTRILRNMEPGETTTITVWRGGEELVLEITLDEKPQETEPVQPSNEMPEDGSFEEWYDYFKDYFGDGE